MILSISYDFSLLDIYNKIVWGEQVMVTLPTSVCDAHGFILCLNPHWFSCGCLYVPSLFCTQCLFMCRKTTSFIHLSVFYSFTLLGSYLKVTILGLPLSCWKYLSTTHQALYLISLLSGIFIILKTWFFAMYVLSFFLLTMI